MEVSLNHQLGRGHRAITNKEPVLSLCSYNGVKRLCSYRGSKSKAYSICLDLISDWSSQSTNTNKCGIFCCGSFLNKWTDNTELWLSKPLNTGWVEHQLKQRLVCSFRKVSCIEQMKQSSTLVKNVFFQSHTFTSKLTQTGDEVFCKNKGSIDEDW